MIRKILSVAAVVALCCSPAFAGDKVSKVGHDEAAAMKEMMNCHVCKTMAPHMEELGHVLKAEVVTLNNGVALLHTVTDASKVEKYHTVSAAMQQAGGECAAFTDADAKAKLCSCCNSIRDAIMAGASFSSGMTKTGDVMVLTSDDPKVQERLVAVQEHFEMMISQHMH